MSNKYQDPSVETCYSEDLDGGNESGYAEGTATGNKLPRQGRTESQSLEPVSRTVRYFPTEAEFDRALNQWLPPLDDHIGAKNIIRDNAFTRIGELLRLYGKGEWSLRPRTFAILRMLGCTNAMDSFVSEHRLDIFLPYSESNLPNIIKGETMRSKFFKLQKLVLSPHRIEELEQGGTHIHFSGSADDYFPSRTVLGRGCFGTVDHVYSSLSLRQYARKRIERGISSMADRQRLTSFENDLKALKRLSHRHIVKLVGSYTDLSCVGLIMTPVADADLEGYLASTDNQRARKQCLRAFFGCLATALGYLHRNKMCHEDIKPRNVLVKGAKVLLTDFGTARIWEDDGRSTTNSVAARTPKYCAPEVGDNKPRGRSSDIWSLGCVFLEMATVLNNHSLEEMKSFYSAEGTQTPCIWKNEEATLAWIQKLKGNVSDEDTKPLEWVSWMLNSSPGDRPTIHQVRSAIVDAENEHAFMCGDCLSEPWATSAQPERPKRAITEHPVENASTSNPDTGPSEKDCIITARILGIAEQPKVQLEKDSLHHADTATKNATVQVSCRMLSCQCKFERKEDMEKHYEEQHLSNEIPSGSTSEPALSLRSKDNKVPLADSESPPEPPATGVRFSALPTDRRPERSSEPIDIDEVDITFPLPEPLKPPPLRRKDCFPLPQSTLSPSYLLAGTNRFSIDEIRAIERNSGTFNLFVYGGLMFPSVLRAIAAKSIKGIYSPLHQRRLFPSSIDWAKADTSIKSAAECMTPALLKGFDRWRASRLEWAVLQDSRMTRKILRDRARKGYLPIEPEPPGEVVGFLILGLTDEALRYCDILFSSDRRTLTKPGSLGDLNEEESKIPDPSERPLQRQNVTVDVELVNGEIRPTEALTYVWSHGTEDLRGVWSPEKFVQGSMMSQLLGKDTAWRTEEQALATIMKTSYALVGDCLCSAITTGNIEELTYLLENHYDPNGPCREYGYPLQAAVSMGNESMVRLLLDYGANVNATGGRYQTPLIAATVGSRKNMTRLLLKEKADIFADGGIYINALYQAVGHSDWAIAEMLLERGAWLTENYREILDLAQERNDTDILELLAQYDWRSQYRRAMPGSGRLQISKGGEGGNEDWQLVKTSQNVLTAVVKKVLVLQTKSGSWRGRKLVAVIKAALDAGAPPKILDFIRPAMEPIAALIKVLKDADKQNDMESGDAIEDTSREEEDSPCHTDESRSERNERRLNASAVDNISHSSPRTYSSNYSPGDGPLQNNTANGRCPAADAKPSRCSPQVRWQDLTGSKSRSSGRDLY